MVGHSLAEEGKATRRRFGTLRDRIEGEVGRSIGRAGLALDPNEVASGVSNGRGGHPRRADAVVDEVLLTGVVDGRRRECYG